MVGLRVLLAEDHALLRKGLVRLLTDHPGIDSVVECTDLGDLMAAALGSGAEPPGGDDAPCEVVLTDIRMPPTHTAEGIEAAERLRAARPSLGVVVLSQYLDPDHAVTLMAGGSGGRGYLLKERVADADHLVSALTSVCAGGSVIDPEVVDALMTARLRTPSSPVGRLTSREREVLGLVATGAANAAIAAALSITGRAVEKHINSIFAKLDLSPDEGRHRRVAAVLLYLADSGGGSTLVPTPVG